MTTPEPLEVNTTSHRKARGAFETGGEGGTKVISLGNEGEDHQTALFAASRILPPARRRISPKRPPTETAGLSDIFPYYAGFSFEWAYKVLQENASPGDTILDPWNGSGTTTLAASLGSYRSIGVDLNPVANVVASIRLMAMGRPTPLPMLEVEVPHCPHEPLHAWFSPKAAARIRNWANTLSTYPAPTSALGLVSLFRVVRGLTFNFQSSNPTWVRRVKTDRPPVDLEVNDIDRRVRTEYETLRSRLLAGSMSSSLPTALITASSKKLPIRDGSVGLVLTSPPYLTRIDYAVAYARELAILGVDILADRR
ncbi:MAG TPA: DNA methyltransferase, partial [Pseudonocardiaceae bacterium]|nr:DNA methyltransferase [Pseudonocardiaceae bacterium]